LGIPMVIMYRLSAVTYGLARRLIRLPFIGIPNILAGRAVVPELLQKDATPAAIAAEVASLLKDPSRLQKMRDALLELGAGLKGNGTQRAADEIIALIHSTTAQAFP